MIMLGGDFSSRNGRDWSQYGAQAARSRGVGRRHERRGLGQVGSRVPGEPARPAVARAFG